MGIEFDAGFFEERSELFLRRAPAVVLFLSEHVVLDHAELRGADDRCAYGAGQGSFDH